MSKTHNTARKISCDSARHARVGSTLVELLVAIPLGATLMAVAVMLLLDAHRLARRVNSGTAVTRELRHAGALLSNELRPLAAADIIAWTDTSVDIDAAIASGIVCATSSSNIVDLLPANGTDATRTAWTTSPDAGDRVRYAVRDTSPLPQSIIWKTGTLADFTTSASACATSPLLPPPSTNKPVRITLAATDTITAPQGTPIHITRRVHYSLYKASDNLWYLGRRALNASGWEVIQPAAGPLRSAAQHGVQFEVRDSTDRVLHAPPTSTPAYLLVTMRAASAWKQSSARAGAEDSLTVRIALRGESPSTMVVP